MKPPVNASVHCPQGQQLPKDWKAVAKERAAAAEAHYQNTIENAWRGGHSEGSDEPLMRAARLKPVSWEQLLGRK
jgi:hypothetical protein